MNDKSGLTAIKRTTMSVPMKWLVDNGHVSESDYGLDYGCGKGFDADALRFDGWDPNHRPDTPLDEIGYEVVTCNYVLNVIEDPAVRLECEKKVISLLEPTGRAYLSVRNDKKELKGKTSRGTWQGVVEPQLKGWKLIEENARFKVWSYTH